REVLHLLEEARAGVRGEWSERNKRELVRALQTQPRNQNLERVLRDLVTENAHIHSRVQAKDREIARKDEESGREKQALRQVLTRKEAELTSKEVDLAETWQQLIQKVFKTCVEHLADIFITS
ncbi:hypothetical protein GBAR_LOCUS21432, partial [Geodia barretti]